MKIDGKNYKIINAFKTMMTVPDCFVAGSNKLGSGHGEAKFYITSKEEMYDFYGKEKFKVKCFMLKNDLKLYMDAIKEEYMHPSQEYKKKNELPKLWKERMNKINKLEDVIFFNIADQYQIKGPRGYLNSNDAAYHLIREIALPLVSYIYAEQLEYGNQKLYYWRLFVDFEAILEKQNGAHVFNYGNVEKAKAVKKEESSKSKEIRYAREGQGKYREELLKQCHFCPITNVADERLLIASHIKPWAASNDKEKVDPFNGYMLSPLYDKLFDRGYITFTYNRHMILAESISPYTWKLLGIKNDVFIQELRMDDKRKDYLDFHHKNVFKGHYEFA